MIEVATSAAALASKELFKHLVGDLYQFIVDKTGRKIKQWNTNRKIATLYRKIASVRRVKTIWQVDKAVDICEFYCDSHILKGNQRSVVRKLPDFRTKDNLLVEGIAGQGKSIFLRYLCASELARGKYIPVFVELRRIDASHTLKDRICAAFAALDLTVDDRFFDALAASGKILLLLDAFDEIPDNAKSAVLTDIEDLLASKPKLRVIVTTRPHQTVKSSSHLTAVKLDDLQGSEYVDVIMKLAGTHSWGAGLANHIDQNAPQLTGLLTTPLMVTLLVILYKSYTTLPATLSEFYDALFPTLLQRHDGTKPGFTRPRRCRLDDTQYRRAFEALCIFAKKAGTQSLSEDQIHDIAQHALQYNGFAASASEYVADIVETTCLVLREGNDHRFIHKTVQEYYTAYFVKRKPDTWIRQFYDRILTTNSHHDWYQELQFLAEIDEYRYSEYYFIPCVLSFLGCSLEDLLSGKEMPARRILEMHLRNHLLTCSVQRPSAWYHGTGSLIYNDFANAAEIGKGVGQLFEDVVLDKEIVPSHKEVEKLLASFEEPRLFKVLAQESDKTIIGTDLLQNPNVASRLEAFTQEYCADLAECARKAVASLRNAKDPSLLDGLL